MSTFKNLLKDIHDEDACYVLEKVNGMYDVKDVKKVLVDLKSDYGKDDAHYKRLDKLTDEHFEALSHACRHQLFKMGPSILPKEYNGETTNISDYNNIVTYYVVEGSSSSMLYKDEVLFTHFVD